MMEMEGRRKLGTKAEAILGGDEVSDLGVNSCPSKSEHVSKSAV